MTLNKSINRAILILPCLLLLIHCSSNNQKSLDKPNSSIEIKIRHVDYDNIINYQLIEVNNSIYFQYFTKKEKQFNLLQLENDSVVCSLRFTDEDNFGARVPLVHSLDSIFILNEISKKLFLINIQGDTIQAIDFQDFPLEGHPVSVLHAPMLVSKNKVFVTVLYNDFKVQDKVSTQKYYKRPSTMVFDLSNDSSYYAIDFPSLYKSGHYYFDLMPSRCQKDNSIYVSYRPLDSLYAYDASSNKYINNVYLETKSKINTVPVEFDKPFNYNDYNLLNEYYTQIEYNKRYDILYRLKKHSISKDSELTNIRYNEIPFSISFYTSSGGYINEKTFVGYYFPNSVLNGLYFLKDVIKTKNEITFNYDYYAFDSLLYKN